jgi:hypothetical protein
MDSRFSIRKKYMPYNERRQTKLGPSPTLERSKERFPSHLFFLFTAKRTGVIFRHGAKPDSFIDKTVSSR